MPTTEVIQSIGKSATQRKEMDIKKENTTAKEVVAAMITEVAREIGITIEAMIATETDTEIAIAIEAEIADVIGAEIATETGAETVTEHMTVTSETMIGVTEIVNTDATGIDTTGTKHEHSIYLSNSAMLLVHADQI